MLDRSSTRLLRVLLSLMMLSTICLSQGTAQVSVNPDDWTYKLSESVSGLPLWTAPVESRKTQNTAVPAVVKSGLSLSAAANEFEAIQLFIGATSVASAKFDIGTGFASLPAARTQTVLRVVYTSGTSDDIIPVTSADSVTLSATSNTAVWIKFYIPKGSSAGSYSASLTITPSTGSPVVVPISLTVYGFELPGPATFQTQMNIGLSQLQGSTGTVQQKNDFGHSTLYDLRMSPVSVSWPSGLHYSITWDNSDSRNAANKCLKFNTEPYEPVDYAAGNLTDRYALGKNWRDTGFSAVELFHFVDNGTPRPNTFCGKFQHPDTISLFLRLKVEK